MLHNYRWSWTSSSAEWDAANWGALRPTLQVSQVGVDVDGPGVRVSDHSGLYIDGWGRINLRADLDAGDNWSWNHRRTLSIGFELVITIDVPIIRGIKSARSTMTLLTTLRRMLAIFSGFSDYSAVRTRSSRQELQ